MPGKTPGLLPLVTSCFQEYTSSLSLVSRNSFWEKQPSCISSQFLQKDGKLELGIPQKNTRGSDFSGGDKEEEQAGAPWRQPLRSGPRMH